ncbi:AsmA-like C-terminal region-containing protein [Novipirellula sp.]|uniref:AsmA-like C-terminal region-containing protein n=1 Tax=Novipirellula sp. TaxID=2795430 RepID=UPI0035676313
MVASWMKSKWRRWLAFGVAAAFIVVLFRNQIARVAAVKLGSYCLSTSLEIDSIQIDWGSLCVTGLVLREPPFSDSPNADSPNADSSRSDPQVTVSRVVVDWSILSGLRSGVWATRVMVDDPCLHVRFDRDGTLMSQFPQSQGSSGESNGKIPLGQLSVRGARLVVHQIGRESFTVADVQLQAEFADSIQLRTLIPNLLGGSIDIRTRLHSTSFAGTTSIVVDDVQFDTAKLTHLPLVPEAINQYPIVSSGSLQISCEHPAGLALDAFSLSIKGTLSNLDSRPLGKIAEQFELQGELRDGNLRIKAYGDPLDGLAQIELNAKIHPNAATATLRSNLVDCDWKRLSAAFPQLPPFMMACQSTGDVSIQWQSNHLAFQGKISGTASNLELDGVPVADFHTNAETHGSIDPNHLESLAGTITASISCDGVDLNQIGERFGVPQMNGNVRLSGSLNSDLQQLASLRGFVGEVIVNTRGVTAPGITMDDAECRVVVADGNAVLRTSEVVLRDRPGRPLLHSVASVKVPLDRDAEIQSRATVSVTPSDSVPTLLGMPATPLQGKLSSEINASCRVQEAAQPAAWTASGHLSGRDLRIAGESIDDFEITPALRAGVISVPQFALRWRDNLCNLSAHGIVGDSISVTGAIESNTIRVDDFAELVSRFSGSPLRASGNATIGGHFQLCSSPLQFVASGDANLQNARYAGKRLGAAQLRWNADPTSFALTSSSNDLLGGQYQVTATARDLDWTNTLVEGQFQDIQASRLVACSGLSLPSSGTLSGGLRITSIANLESLRGDAWLQSKNLSLKRLPLDIRQAAIQIDAGVVSVHSEGVLASGRFAAVGNAELARLARFFEPETSRSLAQIPLTFEAKLSELAVHRVVAALDLPRETRRLRATMSGDCVRTPAMFDGSRFCSLNGSLEKVRWDRSLVSDRVAVTMAVHPSRVELENLSGHFADGRLSGKASVDFSSTPVGRFELSANRVNLRRATAPFLSADMSGTANVQVSGRIGPVLSGRADVSVDHAVMAGLVVREARFPVDWTYSQASQISRWQCRAGVVGVGGGRVHIASEGNFDRSLSMATSMRIERVDTSKLLQGSSSGAGVIDGNVTLNAKRARDPKNIVGRFDLEMSNINALELPVMDELSSLVRLAPSRPGNGQDGGYVYGRIAGGLVHVEELAISQSTVQVLMSGSATMDGRLDFDVTASTESNGPADQLLEMADSPIMMATAAPIAMVAKANELLKDRVVHVHVGGTSARPTLRLQPGKQLSQDAVRFFLTSSLGANVAQAVGPQNRPSRR